MQSQSGDAKTPAPKPSSDLGKPVEDYVYLSEDGCTLFRKRRFEPKNFILQRFANGRWLNGLGETPRVIFNLPEVIKSDTVLVAEGEKDALSLAPAAKEGDLFPGKTVACTTNFDGAGKWSSAYSAHFQGKDVVIFADNDLPGERHAQAVAASVAPFASSVKIVEFAELPLHGDVSDFLLDHEPQQLLALIESSPLWSPQTPPGPTPAELAKAAEDQAKSTQKLTSEAPSVLREVEALFREFCMMPEDCYFIAALWVCHTFIFEEFHATTYLCLASPVKGCGKTLVLEILESVVARPWRATSPSVAATFRKIAGDRPTLLLDEIESLRGKQQSESTIALTSILNSGYKSGNPVPRCVGNDFRVENFDVFCPKAFAAIAGLPDTLADRSIIVHMQRKLPSQKVGRWSPRRVEARTKVLAELIGSTMMACSESIKQAYDSLPELDFLRDRQAEIFEPLFAILSVLDKTRLPELRHCAAALTLGKSEDEQSENLGLKLLADIRAVWPLNIAGVSTSALIEDLRRLEESPWGEFELTDRKLASRLRPFRVHSAKIRLGPTSTRQGYRLADFEDVWGRYLPPPACDPEQAEQGASLLDETPFSRPEQDPSVPDRKSGPTLRKHCLVPLVPDRSPEYGPAGETGELFDGQPEPDSGVPEAWL